MINHTKILERIIEISQDRLNNWELEFISNIYDRHILNDFPLAEGQKRKILEINRKCLR